MVKNYRVKNSHSGIKQKLRQWLVMIGMVMIGVGYAGDASAEYIPTDFTFQKGSDITFIETFEYDRVFDFSEAGAAGEDLGMTFNELKGKVKTQFCPGYIAVCMMTWADLADNSDDYDMQYTSLYTGVHASFVKMCRIDFFNDETSLSEDQAGPYYSETKIGESNVKSITDDNGFKTELVYIKKVKKNDREHTFCFFHIKYPETNNYIANSKASLVLRQEAHYDYSHYKDYYITTDAPLKPLDFNVSTSSKSWNDDCKYQYTVVESDNSVSRQKEASHIQYKTFVNGTQKSVSGDAKSGWVSFSGEKQIVEDLSSYGLTLDNFNNSQISFQYQLAKSYTINTENWLNAAKNSMSTKTQYYTSGWKTVTPQKLIMPTSIDARWVNSGKVNLEWSLSELGKSESDYDLSGFVLQRATNSSFSSDLVTFNLDYNKESSSYSISDSYENLFTTKESKKTFYYRLRRKHTTWSSPSVKCEVSNVWTSLKKINSLSATTENGKIKLKWNLTSGVWPDNVSYSLESTPALSVSAPGNSAESCEISGALTCTEYSFNLKVKYGGNVHSSKLSNTVMLPNDTIGEIESFDVSKGYYTDRASVSWILGKNGSEFSYFNLQRRAYNTSDSIWETLTTVENLGSSKFRYDDQTGRPGLYYNYKIEGVQTCNGVSNPSVSKTDIGFSQPYGVVSGSVTYGTSKQAVKDVCVIAQGGSAMKNRALYFTGTQVEIDSETSNKLAPGESGTVQFYFKNIPGTLRTYVLQQEDGVKIHFRENIVYFSWKGTQAELYYSLSSSGKNVNNEFIHYTFTYTPTLLKLYVNGKLVATKDRSITNNNTGKAIVLGKTDNSGTNSATEYPKFYLDELRFWDKALDSATIAQNYDRYLNGSEDGLVGYYRFDEDIENLAIDVSNVQGEYNGNHFAMSKVEKRSNTYEVPTVDQLSLKTYTDANGAYLMNNLPYVGDGESYTITPSLGVHSFSPTEKTLYFNDNASNHNNVDFTDNSSFNVSGHVYYNNTTFPVEGCNFYVDGVVCTTGDGNLVTSDKNGAYTISVPIGEHYIQVKKANHTFVGAGRYPTDPYGKGRKEVFENPRQSLNFYDSTLVTLVGKVVGGDVEGEKPHGFNRTKANMGQARIKLLANGTGQLNQDTETERVFSSPIDSVKSKATTGKYDSGNDARYVTIETDPETGEFAVSLPPLNFSIDSIKIINNPDFEFNVSDYTAPALADANLNNVLVDSALVDSTHYGYVKYIQALDVVAHVDPTLEVTDANHTDSLFGDNTYIYTDPLTMEKDTVAMIGKDSLYYTMGYPVFSQNTEYTFNLFGYERFVNYDKVKANSPDSVDKVPLRGVEVTLSNELGAQQVVSACEDSACIVQGSKNDSVWVKAGDVLNLADNTVTLDSVTGKAAYVFKATYPQITSPYTRGLNINYEVNGRVYGWDQNGAFKGIILGGLPTGNNFVTAGPDKVYYILRDPAGSNSFATLEEGSVVTVEESKNLYSTEGTEINTVSTISTSVDTYMGTDILGVVTLMKVASVETVAQGLTNTTLTATQNKSESTTTTMTVTNAISTSDSEDYVGEGGDVFIGSSTNQVFGKARMVTIAKDTSGSYSIALDEGLNVSESYNTEFIYTQTYIEGTLIPNLESLRNSCLTQVREDVYDSYKDSTMKNETGHILYITKLGPDDKGYGSSNTDESVWGKDAQCKRIDSLNRFEGPSYMKILPEGASAEDMYCDTVVWYNQQIALWKSQLAANERAKVRAIENRDSFLIVNKSFDVGTEYESVTENCSSVTKMKELGVQTSLMIGVGTGFEIVGIGTDVEIKVEANVDYSTSTTKSNEQCQTVSYELVESGNNDALSVDIYNAPDGFGPIFYTRAGQTSCPYEGEKLTRYYEPDQHTIAQATMKVESPEISCEVPTVSDVPSGSPANYTLNLYNNSDILADGYYYLMVVDSKGADVLVDGASITVVPRAVLLKAGEITEKKLQIKQTQLDVVDYDSIGVVIASMCQYDETGNNELISDTVYLSAHFNPGCSPITLQIDKTTINTNEGELTLKVKDFDRTYGGFSKIYLQYKAIGDNNWNLTKSFALNDSIKKAEKTDSVITTASFNYPFDVNSISFYDQTYVFRAATVCKYGTENIYAYSDEISVVKDQSVPMALGTPSPSNGILGAGDDIYVVYNEPIKSGALSAVENIQVRGVLNDYVVTHETAYKMQGTEAKTEAPIYCGSGDFTLETWLNYTKPGTLYSWGKNGLEIAISDDHKLVVSSNGKKIVSKDTVRQDYWIYLSVSVQKGADDSCYVSANYAYDAVDVQLFAGQLLPIETTSSTFSVGDGMEGYMHELTLWNEYRPFVSAKSQMYKGKYASTSGLIGYWPMNEGKGQLLTDKARSRHLTAPADSWFNNSENFAVEFTGSDTLNINISECPAKTDDNYLVELWFRGTETKASNLFHLVGSNQLSVDFTENGGLTLTTADDTYTITNTNNLDGAWHHFAFNVLRNGNAAIYIDGSLVNQMAASNVPAFAGSNVLLGADFVGQMDEFRYWKAVRTAEVIRENAYSRLSADEEGLEAYYPFEASSSDENDQLVTNGSAIDLIDNKKATGIAQFTEQAPALTAAKQKESVAFSYTASDTKIVIDVTESPYRVDGCTLEFTVKRVQDLNGNYGNPITWTAYMNQNTLVWADDALSLEQESGDETSFSVAVSNNSGSSKTWYISDLPSWLFVDKESGTLSALSSKTLNFTVLNSTPIGYYEAAVLLMGADTLSDRLDLSLKVTGVRPEWNVDPSEYELNMNVIATLKVDGQYSEDENDLIAAFIDEKCVGLTSPSYYNRYDSYYVMMDVYGNADMANKEVQFRIWDASTGVTYVCQSSESVNFGSNAVYGSIDKPIELTTTALQEQSTRLSAGWNWVSMNVAPTDKSVSNVMKSVASNLHTVKCKTAFAQTLNGKFAGSLDEMSNAKMYKVKMNEAANWTLLGEAVDPTTYSVSIAPNWNWIGYTPSYSLSLNDAFAGLNPTNGDMVKSSEGFAIYSGYEWVGSLSTLTPGKGYMYKSLAKDSLSFTYPSNKYALSNGSLRASSFYNYTPVADNKYPSNMTIVAVVKNGSDLLTNSEVAAFVGDECRGVGRSSEDEALVFLTVLGEGSSDSITFKVENNGEFVTVPTKLVYEDDATIGTLEKPYVINLIPSLDVEVTTGRINIYPTNVKQNLYVEAGKSIKKIYLTDMEGRMMYENTYGNATGLYTIDMTCYAPGIYFVFIEPTEGQLIMHRVMK